MAKPTPEPIEQVAERVAEASGFALDTIPLSRALVERLLIQALPPDVRTLDERMAAVQLEIEDVPRRGHAEVFKNGSKIYEYDYVAEADLMTSIRPLLAKHGIAFYYADEIVTAGGGTATVRVTVTLAAAGESREFTSDGFAADLGDKAANKAKTSALRYWLWKTFLQPNDEDPEQDSVSEDEAARTAAQRDARQTRTSSTATKPKLIERIGQLSLEADEVTGRAAGATLGRIPALAAEAGIENYPQGAEPPQLVSIGQALSAFVASERARKEADPDSYVPEEFTLPAQA